MGLVDLQQRPIYQIATDNAGKPQYYVNGIRVEFTQALPAYDAATANWGYPWRMPTDDEISELINKCTWTLTTKNGVTGFLVKSKTNGNTIFLPAGGYMATNPQHQGIFGYYWSSTLYLMDNNGSQMSTELHFTSKPFVAGFNRCVGCLVRPVYP